MTLSIQYLVVANSSVLDWPRTVLVVSWPNTVLEEAKVEEST